MRPSGQLLAEPPRHGEACYRRPPTTCTQGSEHKTRCSELPFAVFVRQRVASEVLEQSHEVVHDLGPLLRAEEVVVQCCVMNDEQIADVAR